MTIGPLLALVALAACGPEGDPPSDAAADALDVITQVGFAPPEPPVAARLPEWACPDGWSERNDDGVPFCHPFPNGTPVCEAGSIAVPGSPECVSFDDGCGSGFPDGIGDRDILSPGAPGAVFVRAGATSGDGTRAHPYGTIAAAMAVPLVEGEGRRTIVLGEGRYEERLVVPADLPPGFAIHVFGSCASRTSIEAGGLDEPTIDVAPGVLLLLVDLRVANPAPGGTAFVLRDRASASMNRVVIGPASKGIKVEGGTLTMDLAALRDIDGIALSCIRGATCRLERVVFERASRGVRSEDARFELRRVAMLGPAYQAMYLQGGSLLADQLAIIGNDNGIRTVQTAATIDHAYIEGAIGTLTSDGGSTRVTHAAIVRPGAIGIAIEGFGALHDLSIRDTEQGPEAEVEPIALVLGPEADVDLDRVAIIDSEGFGISAYQRTRMQGRDLVVRGAANLRNSACLLADNSDVALRRVQLERCASATLLLSGGSHAEIDDLAIRDGGGTTDEPTVGLGIFGAATLELRRAAIERARLVAVSVDGASTLVGSDLRIAEASPLQIGRDYGRGIEVTTRAMVDMERVAIEGAYDHGLLAYDRADVALRQVAITDVRSRACDTDECAAHPAGIGVGAYGASVTLTRFSIARAALCAAHRAADATVMLREGEVAESLVGLCIAGDAPLEGIVEDVAFHDNGTNLNARELPVPQAAPPVELE